MSMGVGVFGGLKLVSGPAFEPVTLGLAKDWLKRGRSDTSEDTTIGGLISAARQQVELDAGRHLPTQVHDLAVHALPVGRAPLPLLCSPVQAVLAVTLYDVDDVETEWASTNYYVDTYSEPARLYLNAGVSWPRSLRRHVAAVVRVRSGYAGSALALASLTQSAEIATATTVLAHGLNTGAVVTVADADQAEYNLTVDVTVVSANQFTFPLTGDPSTPATGTITATPTGVPEWALLAIRMRLAAFYEGREGFLDAEQRLYDWLVGGRAVVSLA